MAEIDSLELKITNDSTDAVNGLDRLADTLDKLKSYTKGGLGLTSVANQVSKIAKASGEIDGTKISNLKGLAEAIKTLSGVGNIKISSSIANQLTAINTALGSLNVGSNNTKIQGLVKALQPLETIGKSNLGSVVSQLKKFPEVMQNLNNVNMDDVKNKMLELANAMKPLADEMQKVANGFSAFPNKLQKLLATTNSTTVANNALSKSYVNLYAKFRMAYTAVKGIASGIAKTVKLSNDYTEDMNLFNASMGKYTDEAKQYAETVGEALGVDPGEWMRNQGIFMTLATGFGVVNDRAYTMSKNLTQLGNDLASFFNMSTEEMMLKLQSGLAGELEPLRRIGFDLSQARLQQEAYTLGIDKKIAKMTQAEKAELRYHAILTQVTNAQGDLARTINAPANQLRVLKAQVVQAGRAIGNIFIPALEAVLPIAIAVVKVIRLIAQTIADLLGFKPFEVDYSSFEGMSSGVDDVADSLDNATESAKKLQQYTMGFDELNVIDPNKGNKSGSDSALGGAGFDFELPEYDFMEAYTESKFGQIVEDMKEWLGLTQEIHSWSALLDTRFGNILKWVGSIGAGLLAWKVAPIVITLVDKIAKLFSTGTSLVFKAVGLTGFLSDLYRFKEFLDDFGKNGATVSNVAGMISEFAGMIGDACVLLGKTEIGGALIVVRGVGEIVSAIADMTETGVNFDNVNLIIRGLSGIAIGIGLFTKNTALTGGALVFQGLTDTIKAIKDSWEAIKSGDWSNVEWGQMVIGVITTISGIVMALSKFSKAKEAVKTPEVTKEISEVTDVIGDVDTKTSTLTGKLKSLATNLAWGTLIVAEVAIASGIIVGAIWGIGLMLGQIAEAWQPVIDNGGTVAIAMGIGTGILVTVGVVTALLGTLGGPIAGQIGIGIGILAELGVASGLFLAEIWVIGKLLDEIGKAWKPVLNNGATIQKGIEKGTLLLVGIGVVTALLGTATVASAGALPIAIGLGTAILIELGIAFVEFCDSLIKVADKLSDDLHPALKDLNAILPDLNSNMEDFVGFMGEFAEMTVEYTKNSAISGFSATVDSIVKFFTKDPIKALSDDVDKQYKQSVILNEKLALANPEILTATTGLSTFKTRIHDLKGVMETINTSDMGIVGFTNLVTVGGKIEEFGGKMKAYYDKIKNIKVATMDNMVSCINDVIDFAVRIKNEVDIRKIDDFTEAIKNLTTAIKELPTSKTVTINAILKTSGGVGAKQYATGGFPETGQMFIAREAGAELVGNIGRKTAVVNNEQIVASVSRGVADANSEQNSLLREQNTLLRALLDKETATYLDGKKITANVEKHQRERGRVLVTGGAY